MSELHELLNIVVGKGGIADVDLVRCYIATRSNEPAISRVDVSALHATLRLDGYAIVPLESVEQHLPAIRAAAERVGRTVAPALPELTREVLDYIAMAVWTYPVENAVGDAEWEEAGPAKRWVTAMREAQEGKAQQ